MSKPLDYSDHGLKNYAAPDKFGEWLGYKVVSIDREARAAEVTLEIREDHLSPARRMHGGVMSAFFDCTLGAALFSTLEPEDFGSTVELKVNYFYPVSLGDKLVARAKVVFRGKKLCVIHGMIYRNGEEQPVAMATGTFNIVSPKRA